MFRDSTFPSSPYAALWTQADASRSPYRDDGLITLVARIVHHATIIEMNVESYRMRTAFERKRGPGRPPSHATPKTLAD
ncbi:MAG: hypothetical protein EKK35_21630 [Bradyrhizobiaceae bacterium]|nr:MAG: hypothetical protein EKK35_21630 [Bradyrhizobiaceae bacterium]